MQPMKRRNFDTNITLDILANAISKEDWELGREKKLPPSSYGMNIHVADMKTKQERF